MKRERETVGLDLFWLYLDQIGHHPLLTQNDEIHLAQAYQAGLHARRTLASVDPDDPARPQLQVKRATIGLAEPRQRQPAEPQTHAVAGLGPGSPPSGRRGGTPAVEDGRADGVQANLQRREAGSMTRDPASKR